MSLAYLEERGDRLVVVNDNAAKRNALSPDLYATLAEAAARAEDPRITSVTLWGKGGFFCAGGDLTMLATRRDLPEDARKARIEELHRLIRAIRASPVPWIAAVEGGAAGAGASFAFACDFVLAARGARFTAAYVKAGLTPDGGLTSTLSERLPRALVSEMLLLGTPVPAERLAELGAINGLTAEGGSLAAAMDLADCIAAGPAATQSRIKRLIASTDQPFADQLDAERDAMAAAVAAPEAAEGIGAFLDKRRPDFTKLGGRA
ncbi:Enoyl-CoA hydratase [Roseivivax lentus]|uniref:Enoyl-CoA hydratase n=1 Tax=Roseivivax lentus TaxID=633194 RepID=A0A1N7KTY9_9RHOB|nr:enoyl-CoA hydratase family protein [Roseivivax lentus]SIS64956.1 Enoyl-CoA hydratase [Roseivivax lentus]